MRPVAIKLRRGTAAQWSAANPVLALGEPGFDTTNRILKVGDGVTAWASLQSVGGSGQASTPTWGGITGTLSAQTDLASALNGKAASSHNHSAAEITGLSAAVAAATPQSIYVQQSDPGGTGPLIWFETDVGGNLLDMVVRKP